MYQGKQLNKMTVLVFVIAVVFGIIGGATTEFLMTEFNKYQLGD